MTTISLIDEKISKLNYINTHQLKPGEYTFPNFIIIGPQRTGTTWLHQNLSRHPRIFMSIPKEIYFFNNLDPNNRNIKFKSDRLEWYADIFSLRNPATLYYHLREDLKVLLSDKLHFRHLRLKKYFSSNLVKGEATASYAVMNESIVREISILHPRIKIVMLLRHPFDRAWSHAKKDLVRERNKSFEDISWSEFKEFYSSDYQVRCGLYSDIIQKWGRHIEKKNFFIGNFDEINTSPDKLLKRILTFLQISNLQNDTVDKFTKEKINTTVIKKIPEKHRNFLKSLFATEIIRLNKEYNFDWPTE